MSDHAATGASVDPLTRFYCDLIYELGEWMRVPKSKATGAATVVKRVARAHGIPAAEDVPLPRLTRAEREEQRWESRDSS